MVDIVFFLCQSNSKKKVVCERLHLGLDKITHVSGHLSHPRRFGEGQSVFFFTKFHFYGERNEGNKIKPNQKPSANFEL